jgi:SAM-dependent methyltransferase
MAGHSYDDEFMRYTAATSAYSSRVISGLLLPILSASSVLDVGCATGTWLAAWKEAGASDIFGIDGAYVDPSMLQVPRDRFMPVDLAKPFDLGRQFDLVQSLEVAEHLPEPSAAGFVESMSRHARRWILFSAAPPGQGGESHVNEKPYEYWRDLFASHGFVAVDAVRPLVAGDVAVSYWYRYNTLLYLRADHARDLPPLLAQALLRPDGPVPDVSPLTFRMRKAVVRLLPVQVQDVIARAKARLLPSGRI